MTNLEKIQSMSSDEMADFLRNHGKCPCEWCPGEDNHFVNCIECWKKLLNEVYSGTFDTTPYKGFEGFVQQLQFYYYRHLKGK